MTNEDPNIANHDEGALIGAKAATPFNQKAWEAAAFALEVRKEMGLLTEDEVAAVLGLKSIDTLATWRSQKQGPESVKLGKKVFYAKVALACWINLKITEQHPPEDPNAYNKKIAELEKEHGIDQKSAA